MNEGLRQNCQSAATIELIYFNHCVARLANTPRIEREDLLAAIEAAVTLLEAGNRHIEGHSSEVAFIALFISRCLGCSRSEQDRIRLAALLHDIGKAGVSRHSDRHAAAAAEIIRLYPRLTEVADMILFHHTGWQGTKLSNQPSGDAIPLGARIIAVADVFQMLFRRQFPGKHPDSVILQELRQRAGKDFDPAIVDIVINNYRLLANFVCPGGSRRQRERRRLKG